ncbi:MAG TPA: type II toxin-antitoxin system RelE/ParE family toxin [Caulobacteraceae bacterium]|nr:type II toxin-antitoxin system RelE/ParE family toxin [Caulobacteraceae bacterium]
MRRATFLASALDDLIEIFVAIATASDSISLAERYVARLRERCHHLAGLPGNLGRTRPELRPDIRSAVFQNYVIFFRYFAGRFEVVNILHGHRDIDAHFEGEG